MTVRIVNSKRRTGTVLVVDSGIEPPPPPPPPGPPPPIPDVTPVTATGVSPTIIYAFFTGNAQYTLEGSDFFILCRLSAPAPLVAYVPFSIAPASTADPLNYTITAPTDSLGQPAFRFAEGADLSAVRFTSAVGAAEGSTRNVILDIDVSVVYTTPTGDPLTFRPFSGSPGPFETYQVILRETAVAGTLAWTFAAATSSVAEQSPLGLDLDISTDRPTTDDLRIRVQTADGTAIAGSNYVAVDEVVLIEQGSTNAIVNVPIINDTIDQPVDVNFTVTGTIVSGTAVNGANPVVTVTILDDDNGGGPGAPPEVLWTQTSASMDEESAIRTFTAVVQNAQGGQISFPVLTDVPITISGTATEDLDYFIDWGTNPAGFLRFAAGETQQTLVVQTLPDNEDDSGETIILQLEDGTTGTYTTPAATDTLTITILESATLGTELLLPAATSTATRMVQGLVAINPPSATLPEYALGSGETVQLVGMQRNGDDEWVSAYFYGQSDNNESIPGSASVETIGVAAGTEVDPGTAGTYPTPPTVSFALNVANVGTDFVCDTSLPIAAATEHLAGPLCTEWDQTGPDLVRQRVLRMQPHAVIQTGTFKVSGIANGQGAGYIELCETLIAGDAGVVLYEGRFGPIGWDPNEGPLATNPYCDGEMYVDYLNASVPAGWSIEFVDAHPQQAGGGTNAVELLVDRGGTPDEPYWFGAGDTYTFWFALTLDSDGDAVTRATDYIRKRNIAWSVGPLGPTDNPIYGETGDYCPDWSKAGLTYNGALGWSAIKGLGEARQSAGITDWTTGVGIWGSPGFGTADGRIGRFIQDWLPDSGSSGGEGVYASFGFVPWAGYWYQRMHLLHRIQGRVCSIREGATGRPAWYYVDSTFIGGEYRSQNLNTALERQGAKRLYNFNDHRVAQRMNFHGHGADPAKFANAPTSRPWNYPAVIDGATLTVSSLTNNGSTVLNGQGIDEVVCNTAIPVSTPAAGIILIERTDGYLHKAAYESWSGNTFTLHQGTLNSAASRDFQEQPTWVGAQISTVEGDPDEGLISQYEQHDFSHTSRTRGAYVDQWFGMRSFLGLAIWRDLSAMATRTWSPLRPKEDMTAFMAQTSNLWNMRNGYNATFRGTGAWLKRSNEFGELTNNSATDQIQTRAVGWGVLIGSGFYKVAGDTERASLNGGGDSVGGRSWVADLAEFVDYLTGEHGVQGRGYNQGNPNPWSDTTAPGGVLYNGPTDYASRSGAFMKLDEVPPNPQGVAHAGVKTFQYSYAVAGRAALWDCFPTGSAQHAAMERTFRWLENLAAGVGAYLGASSFSSSWLRPKVAVTAFGAQPRGNSTSNPPTKGTLAEIEAGDYAWNNDEAGLTRKYQWMLAHGFNRLADDTLLLLAKAAWGRPNDTDQEFATFLMSDNGGQVNRALRGAATSTAIDGPIGEQSFLIAMLGLLLTRI